MLTKAVCFLRYKDDPNIVAMTALADAFERRDVDDTAVSYTHLTLPTNREV